MNNHINLVSTIFEDVTTNNISYGYRFFDDYNAEYCDQLSQPITDELDLLAAVFNYSNDSSILEYIEENEVGIMINGTWYDFDEIKHFFLSQKL